MVETDAGAENIFRVVEKIQLTDIQNQSHGYFGWLGKDTALPDPLVVSSLTQLAGDGANEIQIYMIGCDQIL